MERPLTIEWLKKGFLDGVDLTMDDGTPFSDEMWVQAMKTSTNWLRTQLDISLPREVYVERKDFTPTQWREFAMIVLSRRPVQRVISMNLMFGGGRIMEVPPEWIQLYLPEGGQLQMVPVAGQASSWPLQALGYFQNWSFVSYGYLPGLYEAKYVAGYDVPYEEYWTFNMGDWYPDNIVFNGRMIIQRSAVGTETAVTLRVHGKTIADPDTTTHEDIEVGNGATVTTVNGWSYVSNVELKTGTATGKFKLSGNFHDNTNHGDYYPIPAELLDLAGKYAAGYPLNTAGDLVAGAGIASKSTNIDGAGTSVGTTSSATNAGYGARIQIGRASCRERV